MDVGSVDWRAKLSRVAFNDTNRLPVKFSFVYSLELNGL